MSPYDKRTTARNSRVGHIFGRHELDWHGHVLQLGRRKLAQIEPDAVWSGMWRVRTPDGRLTDMVNLTRARDAARALALAHLNQRDEETPPGASAGEFPGGEGEVVAPARAKRRTSGGRP